MTPAVIAEGKQARHPADQQLAEPKTESFLEVLGVSKSFGGVQAVAQLAFEVRRGEIVALIGPNGAGKTTAFNIISGVVPLDDGKIRFESCWLHVLSPREVAARGIARTFQNVQLFDNMSVIENVAVGRHRQSSAGLLSVALRLPAARREEHDMFAKAHQYLEWVGIGAFAAQSAAHLAYGQRRLLEIARALASEPKLLLLDEPAAGLNPAETESLAELIGRIRDAGITVLLIEHDMDLVMGIADRVIVLDFGQKIAEGTPEAIQNDERVIAAYLGEEIVVPCMDER